ncbi:glycoside hydrolase family 43 protein [Saccharibacillus sp. CPCC 101409]|uniref:glycoside hydrolase family 43 protein n=1 Tax=Saccharibacillus sp. CPCC 101409 TaxID=3058041 RepID=UPI002671F751|nr:glycoside hydrolase family 43 protein [Saccharibacillus sp. CPCC 101409]MDO3409859.1 glycoside hydrolase family 43 protein [Saccharibacillus sp. CPCC 101409]
MTAATTYRNPINIQNIGDPFILKASDGKYYCYPTSAGDEGFKAWSSDDLVEWQEEGFVYEKSKNERAWGYKQFWAPEVVEFESKYYMYYTACSLEKDSLRIGVAVSESPTGPFEDVYDRPMFDFGYAAIDAHVMIEPDGRAFMYYSRDCSENVVGTCRESHIYGVELNADLLSVRGEGKLLLKPDQEWELKSGNEFRWNEGPFVIKRGGLYYLMYSANCFAHRDYAVGYATSDRPLGPFEKYAHNPIMYADSPDVSGPGHHSVTESPDGTELFIVYHTHTDPTAGGGNRQVCLDRMSFREDGSIEVQGPTLSDQPVPSRDGRRSHT